MDPGGEEQSSVYMHLQRSLTATPCDCTAFAGCRRVRIISGGCSCHISGVAGARPWRPRPPLRALRCRPHSWRKRRRVQQRPAPGWDARRMPLTLLHGRLRDWARSSRAVGSSCPLGTGNLMAIVDCSASLHLRQVVQVWQCSSLAWHGEVAILRSSNITGGR